DDDLAQTSHLIPQLPSTGCSDKAVKTSPKGLMAPVAVVYVTLPPKQTPVLSPVMYSHRRTETKLAAQNKGIVT
ncbi:MAG: hypothetical protein V3T78_03405, partial [Dehalococcoidia bacterium]